MPATWSAAHRAGPRSADPVRAAAAPGRARGAAGG